MDASLIQCEQWAAESLKKEDVHDLFRSLCVFEKQMVIPKSILSNLWNINSRETKRVVDKFADLGLITKTMYKTPSETSRDEIAEDYGVRLHDLVLVLCQEMTGDKQEESHGRIIDGLKRSKSVWIGEEIPKLYEWWRLKHGGYIYGNISRHMVKCCRTQALANLLSDVRWTLRRVKVGGWRALKMDFELLISHIDSDIRLVYKILKRHWLEVSKDHQLLTYYIEGSLSGEDRENKFTEQCINSMMRHLSRPLLVPRWKFLGPQDSRELSLLTCHEHVFGVCMDFLRSADVAVVGTGNQISIWSLSAQKELWSMTVKSDVTCVAISANGSRIVARHADGTFQRWDTNGETSRSPS